MSGVVSEKGEFPLFSCVLFDLDQTLLRMEPSLTEKVYEVVVSAHPEVTMEAVERAYASSEIWQGRQIQKENETGDPCQRREVFCWTALRVPSVFADGQQPV